MSSIMMEDDAPVIYGLESQARALAAQVAETEVIRFFVGTQSLRSENQVHLIDFDDENNLINKTVYLHPEGEIWDISSSPINKNILSTCYNKIEDNKCGNRGAIWRIADSSSNEICDESLANIGTPQLELLCNIPTNGKEIKCIVWNPSEDQSTIISVVDSKFHLWDVAEGSKSTKLIGSCELEAKGQPKFNSGRWNPHQKCTQFGTVNDTSIRGWDLRSMKQAYVIENAHCQLVRDIDFNPNRQYYVVSCGDDCYTKFWDIRNTSQSLLSLSDHSHWVWKVRYNHFHDQLILTSSSDSRVILSNITSLSSEPFGNMIDDENEEEMNKPVLEDGVLCSYEEHEDSVYAVEWSVADPWTFASLSYDGRLVINRVPRSEKYKILL